MKLQLRIPDNIQRALWAAVVSLTDRFPVLFPRMQMLYASLCAPFLFVGKEHRVFIRKNIKLPVYHRNRYIKTVSFKEGDMVPIKTMKRLLRAKNKSDTISIISRYPTLFYIL